MIVVRIFAAAVLGFLVGWVVVPGFQDEVGRLTKRLQPIVRPLGIRLDPTETSSKVDDRRMQPMGRGGPADGDMPQMGPGNEMAGGGRGPVICWDPRLKREIDPFSVDPSFCPLARKGGR